METEEDKELMMMRLETLKTMVGKLGGKKKATLPVGVTKTLPPSVHTKTTVSKSIAAPNATVEYRSQNGYKFYSSFKYNKSSNLPTSASSTSINSRHKYVNQKAIQVTDQLSKNTYTKFPVMISKHKLIRHVTDQKLVPKDNANTSQNSLNRYSTLPLKFKFSSAQNSTTTTTTTKREAQNYLSRHQPSHSKTKLVKKYSVVNIDKNPPIDGTSKVVKNCGYDQHITSTTTTTKTYSKHPSHKWHKSTYIPSTKIPILRKSRFILIKKTPSPLIVSRNKLIRNSSNLTSRRRSFALRRSIFLEHTSKVKPTPSSNLSNSTARKETSNNMSKMLLSRHGSNYLVSSNMKSLRRLRKSIDSDAKKQVKTLSSSSTNITNNNKFKYQRSVSLTRKISSKQIVASHVLKKSLILTKSQRKKSNKNKYCLFFNRYGQCKRGEKCTFIHDPSKVAVCTRFLRGTCKGEKCLFSHKVDPSKMPVCSYFLLGGCTKEKCPYRHVKVSEDAAVCEDFLKGYCSLNDKCKKKHVVVCEEFANTGKCSKGKGVCRLHHRSNSYKSLTTSTTTGSTRRKRKSSTSGLRKPRGFVDTASPVVAAVAVGDWTHTRPTTLPSSDNLSPLKTKTNSHLLPKFISERIQNENYESARALTFSGLRHIYSAPSSATENDVEMERLEFPPTAIEPRRRNFDEFIPISMSSPSSSEDENDSADAGTSTNDVIHASDGHRRISMTEKNFISLE